jgi:hypothetical protein
MKKLLAICLLALSLLALPSKAWAWNVGPWCVDAGVTWHCNVTSNGHSLSCLDNVPYYGNSGPWYLYWPYEAHLQTLAPMPFPYWPAAQAAPAAPSQRATASYGGHSGYQTVGYYYYPRTTPNYWYGR